MKEQGIPNFVTENWASLEKMGSSDVKGTPDAFAKFITKELPLWESVVKRSGAKVH